MALVNPDDARCWQCGYLLRGVASAKCPECGRAFDRADVASMNFGRPMGRLGRMSMSPVGRTPVLLAASGCGLVLATFRPPAGEWRFAWADVPFYARAWAWGGRAPGPNWVDGCYTAGLLLAAIGAVYACVRLAARGVAAIRYRPPAFQRGRYAVRGSACLVLTGMTVLGVSAGWPWRAGQRMARHWEHETPPVPLPTTRSSRGFPFGGGGPARVRPAAEFALPDPAAAAAAHRAALRYGTPRQRVAAMKRLVENWDAAAAAILLDAAKAERDPTVRAAELRVLGLAVTQDVGPLAVQCLSDASADVRAAAADALGILRSPPAGMYASGMFGSDPWSIRTDPPINLTAMVAIVYAVRRSGEGPPPVPAPAGAREPLLRVMTEGPTLDEREAAARALVSWPPSADPAAAGAPPKPPYRLRVAEWGVWLAPADGNPNGLSMARAEVDSIPPFVHRVGNPVAELARQVEVIRTIITTKPVIHLTVDAPMAVDLQVMVHQGRPWFAYPKPDDVPVETGRFWARPGRDFRPLREIPNRSVTAEQDDAVGIAALDPRPAIALTDLRHGLPWCVGGTRVQLVAENFNPGGPMSPAMVPPPLLPAELHVSGIGLRWQSLIVSPTRPAWLGPPAVQADPKFAWWPRLRDVKCSWVSSRGEGERFLYYDGPTLAATPLVASLVDGRSLDLAGAELMAMSRWPRDATRPKPARRDGIYIEVGPAGRVRGSVMRDVKGDRRPLDSLLDVNGAVAVERLLEALCLERGLTTSEVSGFLDSWRKPFFETPGRRFLLLLAQQDYDAALPLTVRPAPTETVRLGVVLTEFPPAP